MCFFWNTLRHAWPTWEWVTNLYFVTQCGFMFLILFGLIFLPLNHTVLEPWIFSYLYSYVPTPVLLGQEDITGNRFLKIIIAQISVSEILFIYFLICLHYLFTVLFTYFFSQEGSDSNLQFIYRNHTEICSSYLVIDSAPNPLFSMLPWEVGWDSEPHLCFACCLSVVLWLIGDAEGRWQGWMR